jgi:hypothetical protein
MTPPETTAALQLIKAFAAMGAAATFVGLAVELSTDMVLNVATAEVPTTA